MYQALIFFHSLIRWLVLISISYAIYRAYRGYASKAAFIRTDNTVRHWTATIAHIQLVVGMILYFRSPVTQYFRAHLGEAAHSMDLTFFGFLHPVLMLTAIVVITVGSSLAARRASDRGRFRTMLIWFSAALLIILIAIPWPFSPLSSRPYFR